MKPVLLLDVDGVLNVSGPDIRKPGRTVRLLPDGLRFHPRPYARPFMRWAWKHLDVIWCTTWCDLANLIADWAKLPRRPVIAHPRGPNRGDWKTTGARKMLAGRRGPVFWIEDGLLDQGHAWVERRPETYYLASECFEGVTPSHARLIKLLAGLDVEVPK